MPLQLTRAAIRAKVIAIIRDDYTTPAAFASRVAAGSEGPMQFHEDLGFDSLDDVELVMAVEKAFDIDIADRDAEGFRTIDAIVTYVCAACGAD